MRREQLHCHPLANPASVVTSKDAKYRITVLTDGLVRLEWSPNASFMDCASTFALNRNLPTPEFRVLDRGQDGLEILTSRFKLSYDKKSFSASGLTVQVLGSLTDYDSIWRYGSEVKDLGGTTRTLDEINGRINLGPAVISRRGFALIDDSKSMLFESDGWVTARDCKDAIDLYLFAYGHDYHYAIETLYALSGHQPLLPRWALGNWWSRFHAYSEMEYLDLMDEFKRKGIPMSVAVLDMDWHLVRQEVCRKAGVSGWTGYTWDKSLFPDPASFGRELHKRGLKVSLNDHPADGIASFEEPYHRVARALDYDTSNGDTIPFDITNRKFCDTFFKILHRQVEEDSVCDFWWIDWQQGPHSRVMGIDPLWMLNHFQYLDNMRPGRHPLIFSRFAGPGSHRYPIGFSGDTIVSWESLEFQPEFTNCASNIGYGWWSHDIGGHMQGKRDDELQTRWVQYGVFSPIMRLHSAANPWNVKEPWHFRPEHSKIQSEFLRLRHKLVPYLQTMNMRAARGGMPLCRPVYWSYPESDEAYQVPNQYMFGSNMIVAPITRPQSQTTYLAKTKAWLPSGMYADLFTGAVYKGDRTLWLHRTLQHYPVLAPCGAIIPMDGSEIAENGCPIPNHLEIVVIPGADGTFELLEEQPDQHGVASLDSTSVTNFTFSQAEGKLTISPPSSCVGLPSKRTWTIRFHTTILAGQVQVMVGSQLTRCTPERIPNGFKLEIKEASINSRISIAIGEDPKLQGPSHLDLCSEILAAAQIKYDLKETIWKALTLEPSRLRQASRLHGIDMGQDVLDALLEQLYALDG
ncbi:hypothetical protein N7476_004767 [Penicillium atrosanguineum]|uniref:Alpha-xylosidase n=1 Tax=Penicillium atrosanguineum TaxID=1132637 RepID=A0A9W9PYN1_9EURO|nr:hypothetical protein N7476_004767 [Penicillium atrosanguineum]